MKTPTLYHWEDAGTCPTVSILRGEVKDNSISTVNDHLTDDPGQITCKQCLADYDKFTAENSLYHEYVHDNDCTCQECLSEATE